MSCKLDKFDKQLYIDFTSGGVNVKRDTTLQYTFHSSLPIHNAGKELELIYCSYCNSC